MSLAQQILTPVWAEIRSGPLSDEERQAGIQVCASALATYGQRDMAAADATGLLDMLGLNRPQEKP